MEDTQHRLEETMTAKLALETAKMDQELKVSGASGVCVCVCVCVRAAVYK